MFFLTVRLFLFYFSMLKTKLACEQFILKGGRISEISPKIRSRFVLARTNNVVWNTQSEKRYRQ